MKIFECCFSPLSDLKTEQFFTSKQYSNSLLPGTWHQTISRAFQGLCLRNQEVLISEIPKKKYSWKKGVQKRTYSATESITPCIPARFKPQYHQQKSYSILLKIKREKSNYQAQVRSFKNRIIDRKFTFLKTELISVLFNNEKFNDKNLSKKWWCLKSSPQNFF